MLDIGNQFSECKSTVFFRKRIRCGLTYMEMVMACVRASMGAACDREEAKMPACLMTANNAIYWWGFVAALIFITLLSMARSRKYLAQSNFYFSMRFTAYITFTYILTMKSKKRRLSAWSVYFQKWRSPPKITFIVSVNICLWTRYSPTANYGYFTASH